MLINLSIEAKAFFFFLLHWGIRRPLTDSIRAIKYILMFGGTHFLQKLFCGCIVPEMYHKKMPEVQTADIKILLQKILDSCIPSGEIPTGEMKT